MSVSNLREGLQVHYLIDLKDGSPSYRRTSIEGDGLGDRQTERGTSEAGFV